MQVNFFFLMFSVVCVVSPCLSGHGALFWRKHNTQQVEKKMLDEEIIVEIEEFRHQTGNRTKMDERTDVDDEDDEVYEWSKSEQS